MDILLWMHKGVDGKEGRETEQILNGIPEMRDDRRRKGGGGFGRRGGRNGERRGCWATTPLSRHEHCSTKTHLGLDERVVCIMLERKCPKNTMKNCFTFIPLRPCMIGRGVGFWRGRKGGGGSNKAFDVRRREGEER